MALPARNVELLRLLLADDVGSGCGLRGCRLWGLGVQGFFWVRLSGLGFREVSGYVGCTALSKV